MSRDVFRLLSLEAAVWSQMHVPHLLTVSTILKSRNGPIPDAGSSIILVPEVAVEQVSGVGPMPDCASAPKADG